MRPDDKRAPPPHNPAREDKLARALRENLKRRKDQNRRRAAPGKTEPPTDQGIPEANG